jgi:transcription initiation factor IIE alpha subunit
MRCAWKSRREGEMPELTSCPKCGEKVDVRKAQWNNQHACPGCKEPVVYLIELDRCDWSSGDFFPSPEKEG